MDIITIEKDITVFIVAATSFPNGVLAAHEKVHTVAPPAKGRRFFGISRPEKGVIQYWAGAEEMHCGEDEELQLQTITLRNGKYISNTIENFKNDVSRIGNTFQQMLMRKDIDPNGYCVELYLNDNDVQCMVRLDDNNNL